MIDFETLNGGEKNNKKPIPSSDPLEEGQRSSGVVSKTAQEREKTIVGIHKSSLSSIQTPRILSLKFSHCQKGSLGGLLFAERVKI